MPSANLTDAFVRTAAPIQGKLTEYRDAKTPGLALRVSPRRGQGLDPALPH